MASARLVFPLTNGRLPASCVGHVVTLIRAASWEERGMAGLGPEVGVCVDVPCATSTPESS